jgi:hypothetical protein
MIAYNHRFHSVPCLISLGPRAQVFAEKVAQYNEDDGRSNQGRKCGDQEAIYAVSESAQVKHRSVPYHRRERCDFYKRGV